MPWGRLDDAANDNPKLRLLSDAAWRMWGCGLIYCQAYLTDGFIPEGMIYEFGVKARDKKAVATELCKVMVPSKGPLWHKVEGGYQIHDYLDWNPPKDKIIAERQKAEERFNRHKQRRRNGVGNSVVNAAKNALKSTPLTRQQHPSTPTYHVPEKNEKQERADASPQPVENPVENERVDRMNALIRQHRRQRSRETDDGKPAKRVIVALARDVVQRHPNEHDDGELREILKRACARANLQYDSATVGQALEEAIAQRRKGAA